MAKRILCCTVSFVLLFIISGSLYAAVSATGSQLPQNPVPDGENPVYTITVENLDIANPSFSAPSKITITIQLDGVNASNSFTTSDCTSVGTSFDCGLLNEETIKDYHFQWNTPVAGDSTLIFDVGCGLDCLEASVVINTVVSEPVTPPPITPGFPELPGLTDSEQEVYDSFQSACSSVTGDTAVEGVEGVNNLREACLALANAADNILTNAVIQMTPKQGPAQGTSS
ncbi:MAG: hypothetical protein QNL62_23640, partial [Gammaproteobacteria bacterium]|nr:hypothetical protein [Gammaproteobacteria bacterium]